MKRIVITVFAFILGVIAFRYMVKFELKESLFISFGAAVLSFLIPKKAEKYNENFTKK